MSLLGKDLTFYTLLEAQAEAAVRAARTFAELCQDFSHATRHAQEADRIEKEADELTHQFVNRVDSTFVTPLDKEDLHALSRTLDDVTDSIEAAVARIGIYHLTQTRPDLLPQVQTLVKVAEAAQEAVGSLKTMHHGDAAQVALVRVHALENENDMMYREALSHLFAEPDVEPLYVMKWKDIYDRIEQAVDACADVAVRVESVVVKYA